MHERIELQKKNNWIALDTGDGGQRTIVAESHISKPLITIHGKAFDDAGLEALQLAIACYRQTGSFAALADDSAVPFVGKRMRVKRSTGLPVECTVVECCDNGYFSVSVPNGGLFETPQFNLLPLKSQPTYRPYTPAEAVQFLGRTLRSDNGNGGEITSVAQNGAYVQSEGHEVHHGVHVQSLIDWKTLCDHWVIHDTGEPCGVKEEA